MRLRRLHPWSLSPRQAAAIQARLAPRIIASGDPTGVRLVAAADIAFIGPQSAHPEQLEARSASSVSKGLARAAVVVLSYPDLHLVEHHVLEAPVTFPYIPGLLAFREVPLLTLAFERLEHTPDLVLVDGHGYSHPRRFGIASHLGLLLDLPTIGVAKSRLTGEHAPPGPAAGDTAELRDGPELIGLVLRTRDAVAPVYVSVGHRISLQAAAAWTLRLCRGYRLPEPIRLADKLSKGRPL